MKRKYASLFACTLVFATPSLADKQSVLPQQVQAACDDAANRVFDKLKAGEHEVEYGDVVANYATQAQLFLKTWDSMGCGSQKTARDNLVKQYLKTFSIHPNN